MIKFNLWQHNATKRIYCNHPDFKRHDYKVFIYPNGSDGCLIKVKEGEYSSHSLHNLHVDEFGNKVEEALTTLGIDYYNTDFDEIVEQLRDTGCLDG